MAEVVKPSSRPRNLGHSARVSLLWSGGFTAFRDFAQFGTMLVLVRLLSPADYGNAALAQSIVGVISVISFNTLVTHALQYRDPSAIDWQAQFTAAVVVNGILFCLTLLVACALSLTERYDSAALPLAGLAAVLPVEIAASLRHRMLETRHDWKRLRGLLAIGTGLGLTAGIIVALAGGGVWALIVQVPLFGVPGAIDLFCKERWRPDWSWSWARYRETAHFGATRMGAAVVERGRQTIERSFLAGTFDFAALGVFTRSVGLATLLAGRIGSTAMMALYPVITRAEEGSAAFQRYAALVLRATVWTTVAAAAFLALAAQDTVSLLYGERWTAVVHLLPFAAASAGLLGISNAANSLLLANNQIRLCLAIDLGSAVIGIAVAFLLIPEGMSAYLVGVAAYSGIILIVTIGLLVSTRGIALGGAVHAFVPAIVAGSLASGFVLVLRSAVGAIEIQAARLALEFLLFATVYVAVLRLGFKSWFGELLEVVPGRFYLQRLFLVRGFQT